ncbi:hypothetical protein, partial [Desulfobacula sp.]|uniref:hypothetical protein n=1 Tax=Desulfobacula sp. TaxID=2593537 RepID=UPI002619C427
MRVSAVQWKTFENFKKLFRHWTDKITWIVTGLWQMYKNLILMANIQINPNPPPVFNELAQA